MNMHHEIFVSSSCTTYRVDSFVDISQASNEIVNFTDDSLVLINEGCDIENEVIDRLLCFVQKQPNAGNYNNTTRSMLLHKYSGISLIL